jgi:hypothetical protein
MSDISSTDSARPDSAATPQSESTAGVVAHMAGQDTSAGSSVAGAAPTGGPIDGAARPDEPTADDLDDAGDTLADDEEPPQRS